MIGIVLKILSEEEWERAKTQGIFTGSTADIADGFIHLSTPDQFAGTAEKYFRGQNDLVVTAFRTDDLGQNLKWEVSRGGDLFPHYYGNLPTDKALWTEAASLDTDGIPILPGKAFKC